MDIDLGGPAGNRIGVIQKGAPWGVADTTRCLPQTLQEKVNQ